MIHSALDHERLRLGSECLDPNGSTVARIIALGAYQGGFVHHRNGIATEMKTWEISKQWPFSCFSPLKGQPCIPGKDSQQDWRWFKLVGECIE